MDILKAHFENNYASGNDVEKSVENTFRLWLNVTTEEPESLQRLDKLCVVCSACVCWGKQLFL